MKTSSTIFLTGTIIDAAISENDNPDCRRLVLTVDVGQPDPVSVQVPVLAPAGQELLSRICRRLRITKLGDASELVGHVLGLEVVQVRTQSGLAQPLTCVGVSC